MRVDPSLPLELLNGAGLVVDGIFLAWGVWYLRRETLRRNYASSVLAWIVRIPPHMNFVIAVLVHDAGVIARSAVIWAWRRAGAGDFSVDQLAALALGALMIVVGGLCKIRAVTKPDHGDGPWLACLAALLIFLAGSLISR